MYLLSSKSFGTLSQTNVLDPHMGTLKPQETWK